MLNGKNSVLVVIDVQGKLAQMMHGRDELLAALQKLIRGAQALGLPILWMEQNPGRMGETVPEVKALLAGQSAMAKMTFSCYGDPSFIENLESIGCRQVLLAGIETHVCVYQTAADLIQHGYVVEVVADAVSSRKPADRDIGLARIQAGGAHLTCVEMALFELMRTANHPAFKEILGIVR